MNQVFVWSVEIVRVVKVVEDVGHVKVVEEDHRLTAFHSTNKNKMSINQVCTEDKAFFIQWHLTDECDMRCKHCYIPHVAKDENNRDLLTTSECRRVVDEFSELLSRWRINGEINFSGGNPLMRKDFFEIAEYASRNNLRLNLLGNPTSALDNHLIDELKRIGLSKYQLSIDGMEKNHEEVRGKGTFEVTMKGLENLIKAGIDTTVMSTVTTQNYEDMPHLARLVATKGAHSHGFARLVLIGEGKVLSKLSFTPDNYRDFLLQMYDTYSLLRKESYRFGFIPKDPLWVLLFKELGEFNPCKKDNHLIHGGCSIGMNGLTIDVDGTVYACRRLEIPLGNVRKESLRDLFIKSSTMNNFREYNKIDECGSCELMNYCRGCRAVAYATTGDYFSKDPQCWRQ